MDGGGKAWATNPKLRSVSGLVAKKSDFTIDFTTGRTPSIFLLGNAAIETYSNVHCSLVFEGLNSQIFESASVYETPSIRYNGGSGSSTSRSCAQRLASGQGPADPSKPDVSRLLVP